MHGKEDPALDQIFAAAELAVGVADVLHRQGDLVLGTHGRAALILDDIATLRELTAETMAKAVHLFPAAPAQQYERRPEVSGFGLGHGEFRGENAQS